jgi:hypothetical protein
MADIEDWAVAAANNTSPPPDGAPESTTTIGDVNDILREVMAVIARWYQDTDAAQATTGSSNAYTFASNRSVSAHYDGQIIGFDANHTNTGAATLRADGATDDNIKKYIDGALQNVVAGDIVSGGKYIVIFDGTQWILINPSTVYTSATTIKTDTVAESTAAAGVTVDKVLVKDDSISSTSTALTVFADANTSNVQISGGGSAGDGADILVYGSTHATQPNNLLLLADNIQVLDEANANGYATFDADAAVFKVDTILGFSGSATNVEFRSGAADADITLGGGSANDGARLTAHGSTHATNPYKLVGYRNAASAANLRLDFDLDNDTYTFRSADAGATAAPTITLYRDSTSPTASDLIGAVAFNGEDSAGAAEIYARISGQIVDTTAANPDGGLIFQTDVAGTLTTAFSLQQGLFAATATGGDQGPGTGNFETVYDDGVDVTCYVLEAWLDGQVDVAKWNGLANKGKHVPAEGFATVAADRLDLDKYTDWIRTNRRLPAFPGPQVWVDDLKGKIGHGDLMQRLWETVELQAVHIATLHERLKVLEGTP